MLATLAKNTRFVLVEVDNLTAAILLKAAQKLKLATQRRLARLATEVALCDALILVHVGGQPAVSLR